MIVEKIKFDYRDDVGSVQSLQADYYTFLEEPVVRNEDDSFFSIQSSLLGNGEPDLSLKIAAILLVASATDGEVLEQELHSAIIELAEILDVSPRFSLDCLLDAVQLVKRCNDIQAFSNLVISVADECSLDDRVAIVEAVWAVAMSDRILRWQEVLYVDFLSNHLGVDL